MADRSLEHAHGSAERSRLVNIRVKPADRALIDQAAAVQGRTRSEFMLEAARRAAEETLLDQILLRVDGVLVYALSPTAKRLFEQHGFANHRRTR